ISALVQNRSDRPMTIHFQRYAFPAPGTDYYRVVKSALADFLNSKPQPDGRRIPAGESLVLDPKLDGTLVTRNQLVHGFYEFDIDQQATLTVFQRDPAQSSIEA